MKLFSKSIDTIKADPYAELKSGLAELLRAAEKASVPPGAIAAALNEHVGLLEYRARTQAEARANGNPVMIDAETMKPVDFHAQAVRAEEIREERKRAEQQAIWKRQHDERAKRRAQGFKS